LSTPPKSAVVGRLSGLAIELEGLLANGVLPSTGGWLDQDQLHVELIRLASNSKSRRQSINSEKKKRFKKKGGR